MAWAFGSSPSAAKSTSAGTTLTLNAMAASSGVAIFLYTVFDNTGTSTPTVSGITKMAGEGNSWTLLASYDSPVATSGGGTRGEIWGIIASVAWTAFAPVITYSASITAKIGCTMTFSGPPATLTRRGGSGLAANATGGTPASITFSGSFQPVQGDLMFCLAGNEANTQPVIDSDTTDGSWSSGSGDATAGGGSAANQGYLAMWKIVTANGDQTANAATATGDNGICGFLIAPLTGGGSPGPPAFAAFGIPL